MVDPRENGQRSSPQSYGHTTPPNPGQPSSHRSNFFFDKEVVLPEELKHKSPRVTFASDATITQDEEQLIKDLTEELRCQAVNNLFLYQAETT